MNNWVNNIRLAEIIDLKRGFAFKSNDYKDRGQFILRVSNIVGNGIINKANSIFLNDKLVNLYETYQLEENDILLVMVGATTGKIGRVSKNLLPALLNQNLWNLKPRANVDKAFLYYKSREIVDIFLNTSQGSARDFLKQKDFLDFKTTLPTFPEQQKIAKILRTIDEQIEKTEAIIAKYKAIKQGLMQDLFTRGIDLTTGKLRPRYQDAPELYKDSPLGMIPKEWNVVKLRSKNLFDLKTGGTPSTAIPTFWNGSIPWLSSGEVHYKRVKTTVQTISNLGYECSNAIYYPRESILIALAGQGKTRGTVAITEIELTSNQSVAAVIPNKNFILPYYIYHLLDSQYQELRAASAGAGRAGLNLTILGNYSIKLPNKEEQITIAERFEILDKTIYQEKNNLNKLLLIKKGLMSDLLAGKVRVKVDEEAVS